MQAGNVNTGAFDPAAEICARAHEAGAWVHVDGAFGLWAAAAPARAHLVGGSRRGRFVGDRRAQVAQRALRQRPRLRARAARPARAMAVTRRLPPQGETASRPIHARDLAPRARRRGLGGAALARSRRAGRPDRAHLPPRARFAEGLRAAGYDDPERGRPEPGAGVVRRRRATRRVIDAHPARTAPAGAAAPLAGPRCDAHQRVLLGHHRGRRGAQPRGDPARCTPVEENLQQYY